MQPTPGPNPSTNGHKSPGPPPQPPQPTPTTEEKPPQTMRERLLQLRRNAKATMSGIPRALSLVWEAHKGFTISMAVFSVLFGIMPTVTAWVSKLLIDAVVAAVQS